MTTQLISVGDKLTTDLVGCPVRSGVILGRVRAVSCSSCGSHMTLWIQVGQATAPETDLDRPMPQVNAIVRVEAVDAEILPEGPTGYGLLGAGGPTTDRTMDELLAEVAAAHSVLDVAKVGPCSTLGSRVEMLVQERDRMLAIGDLEWTVEEFEANGLSSSYVDGWSDALEAVWKASGR